MSRPKLKAGAKRENVTLTLPPELIGEAKAIAELAGMSVSKIVEILLNGAFDQLKKHYDGKKSNKKPLLHKG